jgi:hypothetical protein
MKRKQFEPLELDCFEAEIYPFPNHSHTYYELIFIVKGAGNHHINKLVIPYKSGDLYFLQISVRFINSKVIKNRNLIFRKIILQISIYTEKDLFSSAS